jgi:hypothetical protein
MSVIKAKVQNKVDTLSVTVLVSSLTALARLVCRFLQILDQIIGQILSDLRARKYEVLPRCMFITPTNRCNIGSHQFNFKM